MVLPIVRNIEDVRSFLSPKRRASKSVGLVPTMGALHEGHLSLVRHARTECDVVVVSIYVNPAQFAPSEDFDRYPRQFERDRELCEREGVDLLFCPTDAMMYPDGYATYVEVERLTKPLCGRSRPTFFRGVTTVVLKLFNIVSPDKAYFGWKDAQQAIVVKRMVEDLNLPIEIVAVPTVREPDGLAMSSRNDYLDAESRQQAPAIYAALEKARRACEQQGVGDGAALTTLIREHISSQTAGQVEYVEIASLDRLEPLEKVQPGNTLVAVAVHLGAARLIDNIRL
ncbi:pantoate--beta-alanine ligase [candidate division BRC1 bacterium SM23_51]|nr:MAG: pantoate--beta-alanine ligase [candidate division BRC1 bacterium SM23_51]